MWLIQLVSKLCSIPFLYNFKLAITTAGFNTGVVGYILFNLFPLYCKDLP